MADMVCAIRAYAVRGVFEAFACWACNRAIDNLYWSLHLWSSTLLSVWLVEPVIQAAEKILVPRILSSNLLHVSYHNLSTSFCYLSQRNHDSALCSFSCCVCHFWKVHVATDTCLFVCFGGQSELAEELIDRLDAITRQVLTRRTLTLVGQLCAVPRFWLDTMSAHGNNDQSLGILVW